MKRKTNHVDHAKSRIIARWKNDPVTNTYAEAMGEQNQELENVLYDFYSFLSIDSMIGQQLNVIGNIVKQPRNGLSDTQYRVYIKAKIGQNVGSGTLSDIRTVWQLILPANNIQIIEEFPCSISIQTDATLTKEEWKVIKSFETILCAGVRLNSIVAYDGIPFAYQETPDNPNTAGFGDLNDANVGGIYASLV